jgi:fatty-acyl-CoA synthase
VTRTDESNDGATAAPTLGAMGSVTELCTIPDLLVRAATRDPDGDCLVFPNEHISYRAQLDRAVQAARSLAALGVNKGDHVAMVLPNMAEYVDVMLGTMLLGAWAVPINSRYKARELGYVVENADVKVLVTTDTTDEFTDYVSLLREAFPDLPRPPSAPLLEKVVVIGATAPAGTMGWEEFQSLAASVEAEEIDRRRSRVAIRDVGLMMYTSGTTAMPKGCPLSYEALVRPALEAGRTRFELVGGDRMWDPLPMFHMSFVLPFVACLDAGAALLSMHRFEPGEALRYMEREKVTVNFASFPTITEAFLNHPDFSSTNLSFRLINNVAPPDALRSMQARMPFARQISAYGLTEAGGVVAFSEPTDTADQRATTSGRPFRGIELQIRDLETDAVAAAGEPGEILIRGYCLFEGYYKDASKNGESRTVNGWFRTGDIGTLDTDGRVSYLGRSKDMLKVGGENVAAVEIEGFLGLHPAVMLVQVVSAPDAKYTEVAAAFVQLKPGAAATEDELIEFCRGKIASFKIPRYVRFVNEWPMSATKIQKYILRQTIAMELGEPSGGRTA